MPRLIADRPVLKMTSELGRVMAAARLREQAGERVYHLERGEPDFDTPPHIVEALARAARAGETHYPDARGDRALREALVEKLGRENGIACEPDAKEKIADNRIIERRAAPGPPVTMLRPR